MSKSKDIDAERNSQMFENLKIQFHAINRFRERSGTNKSNEYIYNQLLDMIRRSEEASFTSIEYETKALLEHNFQKAEYRILGGNWVFVIVDNALITVHQNESKRWKPKEKHEVFDWSL